MHVAILRSTSYEFKCKMIYFIMKWQRFAIYGYVLFENNGDYLQLPAFSCSLRCILFESNFFFRCEVVFPIRLARWMHTVYLKLFFLPRSKIARNIYVVYGVGPVSESHKKVNYFFKTWRCNLPYLAIRNRRSLPKDPFERRRLANNSWIGRKTKLRWCGHL